METCNPFLAAAGLSCIFAELRELGPERGLLVHPLHPLDAMSAIATSGHFEPANSVHVTHDKER